MQHEHIGDCCQPLIQVAQLHEQPAQHEHHHAALPLGHICTGACLHEAVELHALALLRAEHAMIDELQARRTERPTQEKRTKASDQRKKSKRRQRLGAFGVSTLASAA